MNIGICIVHFGEQKLLDDFLNSLLANTFPKEETFHLEIFDCNKENVGYTKGNNILIKKFFDHEFYKELTFDWFWILNNDTIVPRETLSAIEKICPTIDPKVGIVGFQIRSMEDHDFIHHAGTGSCFPNGMHKTGSVKLGHHKERTKEKWVTGASMLIRREVVQKIGLLDDNMILIGSDSDYCYRARAAGFHVIYEPTFIIYHKIGESAKPTNPVVGKQMSEDMRYFANKWTNGKLFYDLDKELVK